MQRVVEKSKNTCIRCGTTSPFYKQFIQSIQLPCKRTNCDETYDFLSTGRYTLCESCFKEYADIITNMFCDIKENNTDFVTVDVKKRG